ncbi:uncharacterized protein LOC109075527 [Cyprinus carpio]|uniref:Uncharacterized protein LOC109075527 n=1 Tax=Cyprinus carpio TaxID=7962 RepID=A0A9Q9ZS62_CYPCA|nr:uncharacterized protein LOC109075527 [Cyprinus carpio]
MKETVNENTKQIADIKTDVEFVCGKLNDVKGQLGLMEIIAKKFEVKSSEHEQRLSHLEGYTCRWNLRIYGFPEKEREDVRERVIQVTNPEIVAEKSSSANTDTPISKFVMETDMQREDGAVNVLQSDLLWDAIEMEAEQSQQFCAVRGYSGGNVIINYKYKTLEENPLIDVCKTGSDQCFTLINTDRAAEWTHDGRFSVHDDRSARLLRVFIRELNENDSGEYKITVKVSEDYSFFSEFHLNIRDAADCCEKSISLSAAAGGSVNISCRYPQSHSADVKFVCRRSGSNLCAEETSVKESRRWSAEGQMQLYDDREQQLLTGIISHVTQQHSAEYWCGVQSDQGHKSFITRVLVSVTGTDDFLTHINYNVINNHS